MGPLAFIGLFFAAPVGRLLGDAGQASELGAASALGLSVDLGGLVWFTILQAAVSAGLCLVFGLPIAYLLYRRRVVGQRLWRALLTLPFVLPTLVVAIGVRAITDGWGPDGWASNGCSALAGILIAHLLLNVSIVVRGVGAAWARLDMSQEESAEVAGAGRLRTFWAVILPQLRGAIAGSAALAFLYCATSFSVILVLGGGFVRTVETQISLAANDYLDLRTASTLAIVQTLITVAAFALSGRVGWGVAGAGPAGDSGEPHSRVADRRDLPALVLSLGPLVIVVVAILGSLAFKALSQPDGSIGPQNFANLQGFGARDLLDISVLDALANSLRNALVSTAVSLVVGTLVAWLLAHSRCRIAARVLEALFMLPLGTSTVVLGLGWLLFFAEPPLALR
ncbi:MAG: hypothetical protein CGW95_15585, partial [Phenylobacterium zucineum]